MIAIVTILAAMTHGHVRHFLIEVLVGLLVIAVAVFFHGHRVVGNIWRDHQLRKGRRLEELRSRRWHSEIDIVFDGTERVLAVGLRLPKVNSVWMEVLGLSDSVSSTWGNPVIVIVYDRNGKEVCRCNSPQLNMTQWLSSVYPNDYVDSPPSLLNARLRFDWLNVSSNELIASENCVFDENGLLQLSWKQKIRINRDHLRKYLHHLKQPL